MDIRNAGRIDCLECHFIRVAFIFEFEIWYGNFCFLGVFESLQVIIYSNVELKGIFVYIPFAWQMNWMKDILNGSARDHLVQWLICTCITAVAIILLCFWFSYWEGRKNYEI